MYIPDWRLPALLPPDSITYENRENIELTKQDTEAFLRFSDKFGSKAIDKLVEMCDPAVIGYEHVKRGLLYSSVNTEEIAVKNSKFKSKSNPKRERIHGLIHCSQPARHL